MKDKKQYYKNRKYRLLKQRECILKKYYNLKLQDYNKIKDKQNNVCAICGNINKRKHKSGKIFDLHVDHNHTTGKIRGLLCTKCNLGLGLFNDSIELLKDATKYLINNGGY